MIVNTGFLFDFSLLILRIVVAVVFFSSGKSHVMQPDKRSESIRLSKPATLVLGVTEIIGAFSIAFGIYIQIGAILLIATMLGAIFKKIFQWRFGFYSEEGFGWHYDLLLLCANFLFLTTGGRYMIVG